MSPVAVMVASYWTNFVAHGDPNGPGLPRSPSVADDPDVTMNLGDRFAPIPLAGSGDKLTQLRALPRPRS